MPSYQPHSETSKAAAQNLSTSISMRSDVLRCIITHCHHTVRIGATCDEIAHYMRVVNGTIAARLIELEREGKIIKTGMKRKTQQNRSAFVYVEKDIWTIDMSQAPKKKRTSRAEILMDNSRMKKALKTLSLSIASNVFDIDTVKKTIREGLNE